MPISELPKSSLISFDTSTGGGLLYKADGGFLSRTANVDESHEGETVKRAAYTIGVLPPKRVIASYDVQFPAAIAGMCMYDNGDRELAADFSVQKGEWDRDATLAEAVFGPGLQSVVIRGQEDLYGCTVSFTGRDPLVELFDLYPDRSIREAQGFIPLEDQREFPGIRIRNKGKLLYIEVEKFGLRSGITLPFSMPYDEFGELGDLLHKPNPLEISPMDLPIASLGASIRVASDAIYKL